MLKCKCPLLTLSGHSVLHRTCLLFDSNGTCFDPQAGSLKYTHHFGRKRFFTLGEQLILHESVTHSINLSLPPLASVLGAAPLCCWRPGSRNDLLWLAEPAHPADACAA